MVPAPRLVGIELNPGTVEEKQAELGSFSPTTTSVSSPQTQFASDDDNTDDEDDGEAPISYLVTMSASTLFKDGILLINSFMLRRSWLRASRTCKSWYHAAVESRCRNLKLVIAEEKVGYLQYALRSRLLAAHVTSLRFAPSFVSNSQGDLVDQRHYLNSCSWFYPPPPRPPPESVTVTVVSRHTSRRPTRLSPPTSTLVQVEQAMRMTLPELNALAERFIHLKELHGIVLEPIGNAIYRTVGTKPTKHKAKNKHTKQNKKKSGLKGKSKGKPSNTNSSSNADAALTPIPASNYEYVCSLPPIDTATMVAVEPEATAASSSFFSSSTSASSTSSFLIASFASLTLHSLSISFRQMKQVADRPLITQYLSSVASSCTSLTTLVIESLPVEISLSCLQSSDSLTSLELHEYGLRVFPLLVDLYGDAITERAGGYSTLTNPHLKNVSKLSKANQDLLTLFTERMKELALKPPPHLWRLRMNGEYWDAEPMILHMRQARLQFPFIEEFIAHWHLGDHDTLRLIMPKLRQWT